MRATLLHTAVVFISILSMGGQLFGQGPTPQAMPNSDKLKIGEQTDVKLSIDLLPESKIQFPSIGDTLTNTVEVIKKSEVDTAFDQGPTGKLIQRVTVTSFDTGYHAVPPLSFIIDGDTVESEPFLLQVENVEVDTTKFVKDIKDVYQVDVNWKDYVAAYWPWGAGAVGIIALAVVGFLFYRRWKKQQDEKPEEPSGPIEPVLPAHQWALEELKVVEREELWQQGMVKSYYVRITDVVREFIERRFQVQAHELTTNEIIRNLRLSSAEPESISSLRNMLQLADLVKFAKFTPGEAEHSRVLMLARDFVEKNKPFDQGQENDAQAQKGGEQ